MHRAPFSAKGRLVYKDGRAHLRTRFLPGSMELDIPLDELVEDFEDRGIELSIFPAETGEPNWRKIVNKWDDELETRETMDRDYQFCTEAGREKFLDMKVGLMVHFGLYTHIGSMESWAAHARNAPAWFLDVYYTLWQVWNPAKFDADEWARLVKRAGMQFIQITSKHCEGFALWDTKTTVRVPRRIGSRSGVAIYPLEPEDPAIHYSVMDSPFKRDIIAELASAFRRHGLGFGLYYSHWDWEDPTFRWDDGNRRFDPAYNETNDPGDWQAFIRREHDQLVELFSSYGRIDQVFFDTTWFGQAWPEFKAMIKELRALQPDCMFSDRGLGPYGDFTSPERWVPAGPGTTDPRVRGRPWQVCDPIGTHWSWVPDEEYKSEASLVRALVDIVAKGGTFVMAQGPMNDGQFPQEAVDLLEGIGRWLAVNGEAIYATRTHDPWQEGDRICYTRSKDGRTVYLIHLGWPWPELRARGVLPREGSEITMLGVREPVPWRVEGDTLVMTIPDAFNDAIPCKHAFSFKIERR